MKNLILFFVLLINIQLHANVDNQALTIINENSVLVNQKFFLEKVDFKVMSSEGKTVFEQGYEINRQFDIVVSLANLPEGEYHIEMADAHKIMKMKAQMNSNRSLSLQENTGIIYKPQFSATNSHIELHFNSAYRKTKITIRDTENRILHTETIKNSGTIKKRYLVRNPHRDLYTVTVSIPNRTFTRQFKM